MDYEIRIDPDSSEEKIYIVARERTSLIDEIERLIAKESTELMGYGDGEIVKLDINEVECFTVEDSKVYAIMGDTKLRVRERLYSIEERLGGMFLKINQSCIANVKRIKKFESTFGGAIRVVFSNGYKDYVSRRQLKTVKERLGFKL